MPNSRLDMHRKKTFEEIQEAKLSMSDLKKKDRFPIYLLLDNIRSLHNVGAIFRTADACLVNKVYLCGITGCPPRKEIEKTALGATEIVPWEYFSSGIILIKKLKEDGIKIIGLELAEGSANFQEFNYTFPCCFVMGHEVDGISDDIFKLLDDVVEIPMYGRANSLNVATACGILLYEAVRSFKRK